MAFRLGDCSARPRGFSRRPRYPALLAAGAVALTGCREAQTSGEAPAAFSAAAPHEPALVGTEAEPFSSSAPSPSSRASASPSGSAPVIAPSAALVPSATGSGSPPARRPPAIPGGSPAPFEMPLPSRPAPKPSG